MENQLIQTPEELRRALDHLNLNRASFAEELSQNGICVTPQAVWKWLKGKNKNGIPGYVGHYLYTKHAIRRV